MLGPITGWVVLVLGIGMLTWFGVVAGNEYEFHRNSDVVSAKVLDVQRHQFYTKGGGTQDDSRYLVQVPGRADPFYVTRRSSSDAPGVVSSDG